MYRCPKCQSRDLRVEVTAVARLWQDRGNVDCSEIASEICFTDDSHMLCATCEYEAVARQFDAAAAPEISPQGS